jgi:hypothetical protein
MRAIWNWLDFPGWWRGVTQPTDYTTIIGLTWLLVVLLGLAGAYVMATHHTPPPEPF